MHKTALLNSAAGFTASLELPVMTNFSHLCLMRFAEDLLWRRKWRVMDAEQDRRKLGYASWLCGFLLRKGLEFMLQEQRVEEEIIMESSF